ncbi:hypothetical protein [Virgibacillus indicus]|uniref:hypothetical protein n=1 Tax=Virgibacillus indicus TaxID=2024554 RepID=UPI001055ECDC|nr:hypothetical protein [Virgibacillus indicus]
MALAGFSRPSFNTGDDVDFHHKGISATKPLVSPIGKSSLSYEGEGSPLVAGRWALELDVAIYVQELIAANFMLSYQLETNMKKLSLGTTLSGQFF